MCNVHYFIYLDPPNAKMEKRAMIAKMCLCDILSSKKYIIGGKLPTRSTQKSSLVSKDLNFFCPLTFQQFLLFPEYFLLERHFSRSSFQVLFSVCSSLDLIWISLFSYAADFGEKSQGEPRILNVWNKIGKKDREDSRLPSSSSSFSSKSSSFKTALYDRVHVLPLHSKKWKNTTSLHTKTSTDNQNPSW